jgi:2-polyprenyl-3-methyl-5-hydroxy-6-metoxy-1,4-benzoquinol methylase
MKELVNTFNRPDEVLTPWERRGARYRRRRINNMTVYAWSMWHCLGKRVLDIGCGKGDGTLLLSYFSKQITGVDFSPKELRQATLHHYYCPARIWQLNVEKEWPGERFEVITAFEVLEHLGHPEIVVEKAAKTCDKFIFSVPRNAPAPFHKQVYETFDEVKNLVEPFFRVEWFFERKSIIRSEVFKVTHRYIGVGTPK